MINKLFLFVLGARSTAPTTQDHSNRYAQQVLISYLDLLLLPIKDSLLCIFTIECQEEYIDCLLHPFPFLFVSR